MVAGHGAVDNLLVKYKAPSIVSYDLSRPHRETKPQAWRMVRRYVLHRDGGRCRKCGTSTLEMSVHHKHEVWEGGHDWPDNLVTLCWPCHTEWTHEAETWSQIDFEQWLELPPLRLVAVMVTDPTAAKRTLGELRVAFLLLREERLKE